MSQIDAATVDRPEFMTTLGLLPPYTVEDVRQAYKLKARTAHPDAGGSAEQFKHLNDAYEHAVEYVEFRGSRRGWLAAHIERYVAEQTLIEEVEQLGGIVEVERLPWRQDSFGDFAQIAERIVGLRLNGPQFSADIAARLLDRSHLGDSLRLCDLADSGIDDAALECLRSCAGLVRLDLRGTAVTAGGLEILQAFERLEELHIGKTRIRWWQRFRLAMRFPKLRIITAQQTRLSSAPKSRISSVADLAAVQ